MSTTVEPPSQELPGETSRVGLDPLAFLAKYGGVALLALLFVLFAVLETDTFLSTQNLQSVARANAVPGLLAIGLVLVLSVGEFDFSIGAVLSSAMVATAVLTGDMGWSWPLVALVVVAAGAVVGLVNGALVAYVGINSFVVTLATGGILSGLTLIRTQGKTLFEGVPQALKDFGRDDVFSIPHLFIVLVIAALVVWYVMRQTPWGRSQTAIGKGRTAAELAGIRVKRHIVQGFMGSAAIAGLAGFVQLARLGSAPPDIGLGFVLAGFAAVFLGSTMFRPGFVNVPGTFVATFLIGVGINGLLLMGASSFIEQVFSGFVLLAAVALSRAEQLRRSPRKAVS